MMSCEHKLVHLDTDKRYKVPRMSSNLIWTRIDRFFCEKCGEMIIKKKEDCQRGRPDWY